MIKSIDAIFIIFLFSVGCSTHQNMTDIQGEIRNIRAADRSLLRAETQRDLAGVMQYIARGAIFHPPDNPPVIGDKAIHDFYKKWFKLPYSGIFCESDTIVISSSGDLAYLIGNSFIEVETPAGKNRLDGKYTTIWQKTHDMWLCVAVSWSGNEPAE